MGILLNVAFAVLLIAASVLFAINVRKIRRYINMGIDLDRTDRAGERWNVMLRVALGQGKMTTRPIAGFLHILVYLGFVLINIEVLEIIIDGLFGTHRVLSFMGPLYNVLIASFEVLALLVLVACLIFLVRRNIQRIARFHKKEMKGWPTSDANIILVTEVLLMSALLTMNAADSILQSRGIDYYVQAGTFPVSAMLVPLLDGMSSDALHFIERYCWWFHIIGIFAFLNYLPYSKHFHIILAFPNTWYSNLEAKGRFTNLESVKKEVDLMMDPNADPFAAPAPDPDAPPVAFGAKDVNELTWKQLMDGYTCTECGRCTSECPANQTGKLLSPRKIVMDVRDRTEELGKYRDKNGAESHDGKSLLNDYITPEELWACTSCNACTQACPVNIDPLSVIVDLRRHLVMEQSAAPAELNGMFTNIENNGAPWQFSPSDRLKWATEE